MACCAIFSCFNSASAQPNTTNKKNKKILFVVTSHDKLGNTGKNTGYSLTEVAGCWNPLFDSGYEIDFVSPQGGKAPLDNYGVDLENADNKKFWNNAIYRARIENTLKPSEVNIEDYLAIYYAGGHGAMWDFADNKELANIATRIYERKGVVSSVWHGAAGVLNITLNNGTFLVKDKKVNSFTNKEENAIHLQDVVPFLLETELVLKGGIFEKSGNWQNHVVTDQRVVTGQNPASAKSVGYAILKLLKTDLE